VCFFLSLQFTTNATAAADDAMTYLTYTGTEVLLKIDTTSSQIRSSYVKTNDTIRTTDPEHNAALVRNMKCCTTDVGSQESIADDRSV
jgi:hypothetical protein